jgi:predicted  nucleic acid-binding Zn-ribbon protein
VQPLTRDMDTPHCNYSSRNSRVEARRPNLTEALADIKMALTDAKEELVSKDAEIEKMKKQFQRVADIVEFDGYKYDKVAHTT